MTSCVPGANPPTSASVRAIAASSQVHRHAEPADQGRPGRVESRLAEPAAQLVALEIHGHEAHAVRLRDPGRRELLAFPLLAGGVIDLEDPDRRLRPVAERVEAGAQDHVLGEASAEAGGQLVLGEPAPAEHLGPGARQHQVGTVRPVIADEFIRLLTEQRGGQPIGEDDRLAIDDQVGGAGGGCHQGGLAGPIL